MGEGAVFDEPGIHVIATDGDVDDLGELLRRLAGSAGPALTSLFAADELVDGALAISPFQDAAENLFLGHEPRRFGLVDRGRMRREAARVFRAFDLDLTPDAPAVVRPGDQLTFALARATVRGARRPAINADHLPRPDAAARRAIDTLAADRPVLVVGAAVGSFLAGARSITVVTNADAGRPRVLDAPPVDGDVAGGIVAALAAGRAPVEGTPRPAGGPAAASPGGHAAAQAAAHPAAHADALLSIEDWTVAALPGGAHPLADAVSVDVPAGEVVALTGRGAREVAASLFGGTMGAPERGHVLLRGFVDGAVIDVGRLSTTDALASGLAYGTESPLAYDVGILGGIPTSVSGATLKRLAATGVIDGRRVYRPAARSVLSSLGRSDDPRAFTEVLQSWAKRGPHVVVLDEPFDRDVAARRAALGAMTARGAVVVVVSGRPDRIASVADRLLVVDGGAVVRDVVLPGRGSPEPEPEPEPEAEADAEADEERLRLVLDARLRR